MNGKKGFLQNNRSVDYLLDTNFVINYFKGIYKGTALRFTDSLINETTFISVITRIELLGWPSISEKDLLIVNDFITDSIVFSLEESNYTANYCFKKKHQAETARCHYCCNSTCTQSSFAHPQYKRLCKYFRSHCN